MSWQPPARSATESNYVPELIEAILSAARTRRASDVHFVPTADGMVVSWRIDGTLQTAGKIPQELSPRIVARLKILAGLLTYHTEVPQEGRIQSGTAESEMRVSTFPTNFGEQVVVRMFVGSGQFTTLAELGLPDDVQTGLKRALVETGGAIIVVGPAGSGKTTTLYAALRELVDNSPVRRSLISLEDPIEAIVPGASQCQANPAAGFTLPLGLRSLLRQDPEVIMVGEIRDKETAEVVFQASLTGHLVLTSFHAASAASAISRLSDMGIEPYLLRSGVLAILAQRLVRRLCECAQPGVGDEGKLGLKVREYKIATGCDRCLTTGYHGRLVLAELLRPEASEIGRAILSREDASHIEELALEAGMIGRFERALQAVESGLTSPQEVRRTLGFGSSSGEHKSRPAQSAPGSGDV